MNLVCLMPVRNEDWILGLSARAALMWCDYLVVMLHRCTDGSEAILRHMMLETDVKMGPFPSWLGGGEVINRRIIVLQDDAAEWEEMRMRQALLETARSMSATHMALVDADEVLTGNLLPRVRSLAENASRGSILMLPWLQLRYGIEKVMVTGMWGEQNASTAFPDMPVYHWATRDGYDLHHRHPMGAELHWNCPISDRSGGLMHLQFASLRRLLAKQFLYQLTEMKRWPNRRPVDAVRHMYARTVNEAFYAESWPVPESWWTPYSHLMQFLHIDREPWQEAECKRLLAENPGLASGLDDFGLMKEWGLL